MEQTKAKTAEEIYLLRQELAESIISKEADKCAAETKTRTRWADQLIEVQYMIMGSMIDFSNQENKELQSHIANLEAQNKELREALRDLKNRFEFVVIDLNENDFKVLFLAEQALKEDKQHGKN